LKNQHFLRRIGFALAGLRGAAAHERSLRTQLAIAALLPLGLGLLRPPAIWWGLCLLATGLVLATEMINTALEHALDRLHPQQHDGIRLAKDCAAGAVLVASLVAAGIGLLTLLAGLGLL
jgi:diacylglycerol kinase (ATP)